MEGTVLSTYSVVERSVLRSRLLSHSIIGDVSWIFLDNNRCFVQVGQPEVMKLPAVPDQKITAIIEKIQQNREEQALEELIAWWRLHPAADVREVIEQASAVIAEARNQDLPTIPKKLTDKFQDQWFQVAEQQFPGDIPWLCDGWSSVRIPKLEERCEFFLSRPPDPRMTEPLVQLLSSEQTYAQEMQGFWIKVFLLFEQINEPQIIPHLLAKKQKIAGKRHRHFEAFLERKIDSLLEKIRPLPESYLESKTKALIQKSIQAVAQKDRRERARSLLEQRQNHQRIPEFTQKEQSLCQGVYDQPSDDAARLVLADWLLEREEPRGRFIALQYANSPSSLSSEERKEELLLLRRNVFIWLQPIYRFLEVGTLSFSKGFLSGCNVLRVTQDVIEHPIWNTVTQTVAPAEFLIAKRDSLQVWGRTTQEAPERPFFLTIRVNWFNSQCIPLGTLQLLAREKTRFAVQQIIVSDNKSSSEALEELQLAPLCFPRLKSLAWLAHKKMKLWEKIDHYRNYHQALGWLSAMAIAPQLECLIIGTYGFENLAKDVFDIPSLWAKLHTLQLELGKGWHVFHQRNAKGIWKLRIVRMREQTAEEFKSIHDWCQQAVNSNYERIVIASRSTPFTEEQYLELLTILPTCSKLRLEPFSPPAT
jgi:uncharacterized protein (TIGR02996 family)